MNETRAMRNHRSIGQAGYGWLRFDSGLRGGFPAPVQKLNGERSTLLCSSLTAERPTLLEIRHPASAGREVGNAHLVRRALRRAAAARKSPRSLLVC